MAFLTITNRSGVCCPLDCSEPVNAALIYDPARLRPVPFLAPFQPVVACFIKLTCHGTPVVPRK